MTNPRLSLIGAFIVALSIGAALAQAQAQDHSKGHGQHMTSATTESTASTEAFIAANDKMHAGMEIEFTGNADADFLRGMIPHHEGAIDMARIVLEHGSDPEVKRLAEEIIRAQEGEIAFMRKKLGEMGY